MNDYRTLLAEQFRSNSLNRTENGAYLAIARSNAADALLNTRVPWLCPDCKGQGEIALPEWEGNTVDCHHGAAPTIGDLLRWGEAWIAALRTEADQ